jgi:hypothetical protein
VLAACLSKPTGIIAPAMAVVLDVLLLRTPWRRSLATLSSWFAIAIVFAIVGAIVQPPVTTDTPPLWLRPLVALDALAFYIWKIIWPARLAIDYGRTPAQIIASGAIWWTWLLPIAVAVVAIVFRRNRMLLASLLLFVIGVAPVLGFVPFTFQTISTVADHYMYPSMLGVAVLVGMFASRGAAFRRIGLGLVVAMSARSFVAAGAWQNNDALFFNALNVNPRSAMSHTNWGVALAQRGDHHAALDHFAQAVAVDPDYAFGRLNLANLLRAQGRHAEAAREFRELLRLYRKQRNVDPHLIAGLERLIEQLEQLERSEPAR